MMRNIIGGGGIVMGLVIVAMRLAMGSRTELMLGFAFWPMISMGIGFGVLFALDLKAVDWMCDLIGAPKEWPQPPATGSPPKEDV